MSGLDLARQAIDPVYATFGKAAVYRTPDRGIATPCTVILTLEDQQVTLGDTRAIAGGMMIEVRRCEIAQPVKGGSFTIGSDVYAVISQPKSEDPERMVFAMTVRR